MGVHMVESTGTKRFHLLSRLNPTATELRWYRKQHEDILDEIHSLLQWQ